MQRLRFSLNISSEQYQAYYQGSAKFIRVQAEDGRTIKFPASEMQKFVTHNGIQGRFEIVFNNKNKLVSLKVISK